MKSFQPKYLKAAPVTFGLQEHTEISENVQVLLQESIYTRHDITEILQSDLTSKNHIVSLT